MYVLVRLIKGFGKPLFYRIPESNTVNIEIGKILNVPIKNQFKPALVLRIYNRLPESVNFDIKDFVNVHDFPDDTNYRSFLEKIAKFYFMPTLHFYRRINSFLLKKPRIKPFDQSNKKKALPSENKTPILTQEQQEVVNYVQEFIKEPTYKPTLIHGVTGSGKTEVYKNLIIQSIEKNKSVILLLPEVSLSLQFQYLLEKQLPENIKIISFHSASRPSEKEELWQRLISNQPTLIIGVHLPILLPIANLGLIIIDEEHEQNFQEKKHPKINSKEVAIWRAQHYNIPIILGSATPSINSLYSCKKNSWKYFQLKKRFSGRLPEIQTVLLNQKVKKRRPSFWISQELHDAILDRLEKKEQIIIYLNRRGYSFFVQCKKCGFIFQCPDCSVSLTVHSNNDNIKLHCHYCDYKQDLPSSCPECKAGNKELLKKGIGTQQAVNIIKNLFPQALVERADLDSTSKKRSWQETVQNFDEGKIDILIGTQVITKGYHFPNVTLVGILWADLNLHFPVFNASETTLQQLIQVAGRAGRGEKKSCVIVQTMQDHDIFKYLHEPDYLKFCKQELELREMVKYPPFIRLVQIELKNTDSYRIEQDAYDLHQNLELINNKYNLDIRILGPSKPVVHRIQKTESRLIYLKAKSFKNVHELINKVNLDTFNSKIYIIPTP